jgi:hypothetical protein
MATDLRQRGGAIPNDWKTDYDFGGAVPNDWKPDYDFGGAISPLAKSVAKPKAKRLVPLIINSKINFFDIKV